LDLASITFLKQIDNRCWSYLHVHALTMVNQFLRKQTIEDQTNRATKSSDATMLQSLKI